MYFHQLISRLLFFGLGLFLLPLNTPAQDLFNFEQHTGFDFENFYTKSTHYNGWITNTVKGGGGTQIIRKVDEHLKVQNEIMVDSLSSYFGYKDHLLIGRITELSDSSCEECTHLVEVEEYDNDLNLIDTKAFKITSRIKAKYRKFLITRNDQSYCLSGYSHRRGTENYIQQLDLDGNTIYEKEFFIETTTTKDVTKYKKLKKAGSKLLKGMTLGAINIKVKNKYQTTTTIDPKFKGYMGFNGRDELMYLSRNQRYFFHKLGSTDLTHVRVSYKGYSGKIISQQAKGSELNCFMYYKEYKEKDRTAFVKMDLDSMSSQEFRGPMLHPREHISYAHFTSNQCIITFYDSHQAYGNDPRVLYVQSLGKGKYRWTRKLECENFDITNSESVMVGDTLLIYGNGKALGGIGKQGYLIKIDSQGKILNKGDKSIRRKFFFLNRQLPLIGRGMLN